MEDSVYSIHLLIIILVIVLVLDTRESTVLVSDIVNWLLSYMVNGMLLCCLNHVIH